MIHIKNVTKHFGARAAVDNLTLDVPEGEIFGMLGHNGAGKSTTIGMLLGQVWPGSGEIHVCGFDVTTQRHRALQSVGAIFEAPVFYDYLSGYRNLEILTHYTAPTTRQRIMEVVEWVGLSGRERSLVRTYSHGMRARLALAQALLPSPKMLILDEPSDGLDPEGIHEIRHTILRLHRELGMTIFLSSHLLNEVELLCTRIAVMRQGRKVFDGTLDQAKQGQSLVKLRTSRFGAAVELLQQKQLITSSQDARFLALAPGVEVSQVVCALVENQMPVHEIGPVEMTLEDFYLSLMKGDEKRSSN